MYAPSKGGYLCSQSAYSAISYRMGKDLSTVQRENLAKENYAMLLKSTLYLLRENISQSENFANLAKFAKIVNFKPHENFLLYG